MATEKFAPLRHTLYAGFRHRGAISTRNHCEFCCAMLDKSMRRLVVLTYRQFVGSTGATNVLIHIEIQINCLPSAGSPLFVVVVVLSFVCSTGLIS